MKNSPVFTKTAKMYFPNVGDVYVFRFSYGDTPLIYLGKSVKGYCFFNAKLKQPCVPMDETRFGYLIRKQLTSYEQKVYDVAQVEEFKKVAQKEKQKRVNYKSNGLQHFRNETRYTKAELDELIDDINDIKF